MSQGSTLPPRLASSAAALLLLAQLWACGGDSGRDMAMRDGERPMGPGTSLPNAGTSDPGEQAAAGSHADAPVSPTMSQSPRAGAGASAAPEPELARPAQLPRPRAPDEPLAPPACGGALAPGETRAVVSGVLGRPAIDEAGNVYVPTATEQRELALTKLDPCGEPVWQKVVAPQLPEWPVAARLPGDDEVVLDALPNFRWDERLWRFDRSGAPLAAYATQGDAHDWVAATSAGVFMSTFEDDVDYLTQLMPDGAVRRVDLYRLAPDYGFPVKEEECAAFDGTIGCYSGSFDARASGALWNDEGNELIDGATRHVVSPASDGERLYSFAFGTTHYRLVASQLTTGERIWSQELGPTPAYQTGVGIGAPVIGSDGTVYVYFAYSTAPVTREVGDIIETVKESVHSGWLIAFDRAGDERWRTEALTGGGAGSLREHGTHLLGNDGVIYLATGRGLFAIDALSGELRWQRSAGLSRLRTPRLAMSPNGDLLVQFDDDQLMYVATGARGTADSPWPAPGGDRRNLNSR